MAITYNIFNGTVGLIIGFLIGLIVGFILALRVKKYVKEVK